MNKKLKFIVIAIAAVAAVWAARQFDAQTHFQNALDTIEGLGPWGPAAFVAIYVVACVFLMPGSVLTLGAGAIWGVVWGTVWVSVASVSGAVTAFLIARYLARDWAKGLISGNPKFAAMDKALEREGLRLVFLIRLSPAFPFNVLNYAFGLSPVKFWHHLLGSWAGMIPGTIMYVYLGSLAGEAVGGAPVGGPPLWFKAVGLVATIAVVLYIVRIALNAVNKELEPA